MMNKVIKTLSCVAFVLAFCCMAIGYAAVQDTLTVSGTVSFESQKSAFAVYGPIYGSDEQFVEYALNFYNRPIVQESGEIPLGEGKQVVTAVYTADEWSFNEPEEQPWRFDLEGIESIKLIASVAVIDDHIQPTKTRSWFADFTYCTTFDLAKLDTSKVTEMGYMFKNCTSVQHLDLSRFETSGFVDYGMDEICMSEMFYGCSNLETLDISLFENGPVVSMLGMFSECEKLRTIYAGSGLDGYRIQEKAETAFDGCTSLIGGNGTTFDSSKSKADHARIDGLDGLPGYFTCKHTYDETDICTICGAEKIIIVTTPQQLTDAKNSGKDYIVNGGEYTSTISASDVYVIVNGAETKASNVSAFSVSNGGTLVLNDVTEVSAPGRGSLASVSNGTLIIDGGTYAASSIAMDTSSHPDSRVIIYDGNFTISGFHGMYGYGSAFYGVNTITIYGGTFNIEPTSPYLAPGYVAQDNGDGTWTVVAA